MYFKPVQVSYRPFFIVKIFGFLRAGHAPVLIAGKFPVIQLGDIFIGLVPVEPFAKFLKRVGLVPHQAGFGIRYRAVAIVFKPYFISQV